MPVPAGGSDEPSTVIPDGAYAAPADLDGVVDPIPANVDRLLVLASREVDRALLTAVYDVDDADVQAALEQAVVEQVVGMLASGDSGGLGVTSTPTSFQLGKLQVQGVSSGPAPRTGRLYDQAWQVLSAAGLLGQGPGEPIGWCW